MIGPLTLTGHLWLVYQRAYESVAAEQYYGDAFCARFARSEVKAEQKRLTALGEQEPS